ncbi:MAG: hypothetical protein ACE5KW_04080 [Dehalococcoidia bacterium]
MREINRSAIIALAGLLIIAMAVVAFIAWAAPDETVARLRDLVQYLDDHNDNAGRLIVTLGTLTLIVIAVLVIVIEMAPEEEPTELQLERAGTTTFVAAAGLRQRLEEVLLALPAVTAARVGVAAHKKAVALSLDLTLLAGTNVTLAGEEATRAVAHTLEEEMGLPLAGAPRLRIIFGKAAEAEAPPPSPVVESAADAEAPEGRPGDEI